MSLKKCVVLCMFLMVAHACLSQKLSLNKDSLRGRSFSIQKFNDNLNNTLRDSAVGWTYSIWKNGKPVFEKSGGYKITPRDSKNGAGLPFTPNTRIHVASLSKTITALTVAKLVELKKLRWEDEVRKYLPAGWRLHPAFEHLTVRNLVAMKSGLNTPLDMVSSSIDSLQLYMEKGPDSTKVGVFHYQNSTYGLLRLVIAYADGYGKLAADVDPKSMSLGTALIYKNAVRKYILSPAGVDSADCRINEPYPAFQYPFPYNNEAGELTGSADLTEFAGAFGWFMSAREAAQVLDAVFNKRKIVSSSILEELIGIGFPIKIRNGKYGSYFGTGGDWGHPIKPQGWRGIHTYFYCLPDNMLVVVFMNSGEGSPARRMMKAYVNSFE